RQGEGDVFPLSFAQERLWFLDQLTPGSAAYTIFGAIGLSGRLDVAALHQSLQAIVERHEALRTVFVILDEQPVQRILPSVEIALPVEDLQALPAEQREEEILRRARIETSLPFDL